MQKVIIGAISIAIVAAVCLGILAGVWLLWCFVAPQLWPSGPANIIQPGYWFFAATWTLFACIGKALFGSSK